MIKNEDYYGNGAAMLMPFAIFYLLTTALLIFARSHGNERTMSTTELVDRMGPNCEIVGSPEEGRLEVAYINRDGLCRVILSKNPPSLGGGSK